jgi:hypothetical protein
MKDYYRALERLENGKTKFVPPGTKISNDSVSLEAGRKKGSIKKSRSQFEHLISMIQEAAKKQNSTNNQEAEDLKNARLELKSLRDQLDLSRGRELSLLSVILHLKQKLHDVTGDKIIPIFPPKRI